MLMHANQTASQVNYREFPMSIQAVQNGTRRMAAAPAPAFSVQLAGSDAEIRESQRLRYRIFAQELGAEINTSIPGHDVDAYDPYCHHILVRDGVSGELAASTRVLLHEDAERAGGFYSSTEFDMQGLLDSGTRLMEIGRTCVHPEYRTGSAISMVWAGLARLLDIRAYDYLVGCASISMTDGGNNALAIYAMLQQKYLMPEELQVTPRLRLPPKQASEEKPSLPPLLKGYLRIGARIGGEPCWDPLFNTADLMIVLSPQSVQNRYARHYLER